MPLPTYPTPFIVGLPRSGTTLLKMMLDAHPALAMAPKTAFLTEAVTRCRAAGDPHATFLQTVVDPASNAHWCDWSIEVDTLQQQLYTLQPFSIAAALRTLYRLYSQQVGKARYGDKTPEHRLAMPLIQRLLPEAHFIHLIRDGRAQWVSERKTAWGTQSARRGALRWVTQLDKARRVGERLPHYREIRYEVLVNEPIPTLQQLCAFLGLPWHAEMLAYPARAVDFLHELHDVGHYPVENRRHLLQNLTEPPNPARVDTWRKEVTAAEIYEFEQFAGDRLRALGYATMSKADPALSKIYRMKAQLRTLMIGLLRRRQQCQLQDRRR